MRVDRRAVIVGAGASFTFLLPEAWAQPAALRTRPAVDSAAGQIMLAKYAKAVQAMSAAGVPWTSPRSWRFQWYTHAVPTDKQAELDRLYGPQTSRLKDLAAGVWNTCQAHKQGTNPDMFLPWHRMYILAFEQIIRAVLGDPDFDLPYWDYTRTGNRAIPAAFQKAAASPGGSLYRKNRNLKPDINNGKPMDEGLFGDPFGLGDMGRPTYSGPIGFCHTLDQGLHGRIHGGVGDGSNMGTVETAAGDPIFWLHHCNIDRIWAGWNEAGGVNTLSPAKFAFASPDLAGARVEWDATAVGDTAALGYRYDALPVPPPKPVSAGTAGGPLRTIAVSAANIPLGPLGARVPLSASAPDGEIAGSVASSTASGHIFLLLSGLMAKTEPGTLYELFVDLPANASAGEKAERYLGTFSFFGASGLHGHAMGAGPSFEITDQLAALRARNLIGANIAVTVLPVGAPQADAQATIGTIEMLRQ